MNEVRRGTVKRSNFHFKQIILTIVCKMDQQLTRLETLEYELGSHYNPTVALEMENKILKTVNGIINWNQNGLQNPDDWKNTDCH